MNSGGLRFHRQAKGRVRVPHAAALSLTSWTVIVSGRLGDYDRAITNTYQTILSKGKHVAGQTSNYFIQLWVTGGIQYYRIGFIDPAEGINDNDVNVLPLGPGSSSNLIGVPQWFVICATYDETNSKLNLYTAWRETAGKLPPSYYGGTSGLYNNTSLGVVVGGAGGAAPVSTDDLTFGCDLDASGNPQNGFDGSISDVRIYSSVLTKAQCEAVILTRPTGQESGLVGCWFFDEAGGSTVYDRVPGSGNNGAIVGGEGATEWTDAPMDLAYPGSTMAPYGLLGIASATRRPLAAITASSEAAAYPASDLRSPIQGRPFRSSSVAAAVRITIDAGEAVPVWALSAYNHNLTSKATITIEGHTADSWGAPAYSATLTYNPGTLLFPLASPQMYRWWRISFTDTTNADGYIELGTLDLWDAWPFPESPQMTRQIKTVDPSESNETPDGDAIYRELAPSEEVSFSFLSLRRPHADYLRDLLRDAGQGRPVLAVIEPTRALYSATVYGYIRSLGSASMGHSPAWTHTDMPAITITADRE